MDPRQLFPVLATVFVLLALVSGVRSRNWRGAPRIWLVLALIFATVSTWLRLA